MTVFDTDIATDLIQSRPSVVARAQTVPRVEQAITIVTVEEIFRGRLNYIRQADSGKVRASLEEAYALLNQSMEQVKFLRIVPYDSSADVLFKSWRAMKVRVGTRDLRIAAICFVQQAKFVTRNARDFANIPGLNFEVWN